MESNDAYRSSRDTYRPQRRGEEVEVVQRGVVNRVGPTGFWIDVPGDGPRTWVPYDAEHVVSVTPVRPPLPTEPDTYLTDDDGRQWRLHSDGLFRQQRSRAGGLTAEEFAQWSPSARVVAVPVQSNEPPPYRPDPNLMSNAEGDWKALRRTVAAAKQNRNS